MSNHSATLETYYGQRAAEYDRIYEIPERQPDLRKLRDLLVDALRGRRVLEVACGTGYWTERVADAAHSVLATDLVRATLDVARGRRTWPESTEFACADAFSLAADPAVAARAPFTAVFAGFWVSHVLRERLPEFLAALHRVLAPGAIVVLFDNRFVAGSSTPISRTAPSGDTYQTRRLQDGRTFEVLKNFHQPQDLLAALTRAGGAAPATVRIDLLPYYWIMTYHTEPSGMRDQSSDLARFVDAQAAGVYERALAELEAGRKRTHWMWFIFPQLRGLGSSDTAVRFGISGLAEAQAYLRHEVLGTRLRHCAAAALQHAGESTAEHIFGYPDHLKFRSCATLFAAAAEPSSVFHQVLDAFFDGEPDERTLALLEQQT